MKSQMVPAWKITGPGMHCDFCVEAISPEDGISYFTRRFFMADHLLPYDDDGMWLACAVCHPLVEAHDIEGLLKRAALRRGDQDYILRGEANDWRRKLYEHFFANLLPGCYHGVPMMEADSQTAYKGVSRDQF